MISLRASKRPLSSPNVNESAHITVMVLGKSRSRIVSISLGNLILPSVACYCFSKHGKRLFYVLVAFEKRLYVLHVFDNSFSFDFAANVDAFVIGLDVVRLDELGYSFCFIFHKGRL